MDIHRAGLTIIRTHGSIAWRTDQTPAESLEQDAAEPEDAIELVMNENESASEGEGEEVDKPVQVVEVAVEPSVVVEDANVERRFEGKARSKGTIVTAYFQLNSKHPVEQYLKWMTRMLSLPDPMVIFTSADLVPLFTRMRAGKLERTVIIETQLEDTKMAREFPVEFWQRQFERDPEKGKHKSYKLFWIWNGKADFVRQAIEMNPFNSSYFMWSDIGCYRFERPNGSLQLADTSLLDRHPEKIMLVNIKRYKVPLYTEKNAFFDTCGGGVKCRRIAGAQYAGTLKACLKWYDAYYDTIKRYVKHGRFIGEDQNVMAGTCLRHPSNCLLFHPVYNKRAWFGLQPVLRGRHPKVYTILDINKGKMPVVDDAIGKVVRT